MAKKMRVASIFMSDMHMGTKAFQAEAALDFMKHYKAKKWVFNGDILDFWRIVQNKWVWYSSHSGVCEYILGLAEDPDTEVVYNPGNHDETLRFLAMYGFNLGGIKVVDETTHYGIDGKRYLVTHGDLFDGISDIAPWLAHFGDKAYDIAISLNTKFNWIRRRLGFGYWSLSKWLKSQVKTAVGFIFKFEHNLAEHCKKKGYDGVICGHIHHADIKKIGEVMYMNSGDWVEGCTALIEHLDGSWEIITWETT